MRAAVMVTRIVGSVLCLVLVGSLVIPFFAVSWAHDAVPRAATAATTATTRSLVAQEETPVMEPEVASSSGVRELPVRTPSGAVEQMLTTGAPLDRSDARDAVVRLATTAGLWPGLEDAVTNGWWEGTAEVTPDHVRRYEPIDSVVAAGLSGRKGDRDVLLDLSAALIAWAAADGGSSRQDEGVRGGVVAYSLLRQVAKPDDCELLINLAFAVSIGDVPEREAVDQSVAAARDACGQDDPTPDWIRAKYLANSARIGNDLRVYTEPPSVRRQLALDAFAELRQDFPDLPIGWAGEADLLLAWADGSERLGVLPFQAQEWRERALELYVEARSVSADARLLVGHGRALLASGDADQALELLDQAVALVPDADSRIVRTRVLSALGEHADAAASIVDEADAASPWWAGQPPSVVSGDFMTGAYATAEFPPVSMYDATLLEAGGASVSDYGAVPVSRYRAPDVMCGGARRLDQLLLAEDTDEVQRLLDDGLSPTDDLWGGSCYPYDPPAFELTPELYRTMAFLLDGRVEEAEAALADANYPALPSSPLSHAWDRLQDLQRREGELMQARLTTEAWLEASPEDTLARQRLAEVYFLDGKPRAAADEFSRAAEDLEAQGAAFAPSEPQYSPPSSSDRLALTLVQQASAEIEAGRNPEASLDQAMQITDLSDGDVVLHAYAIRFNALKLLGDRALTLERWDDAVSHLTEAAMMQEAFLNEDQWWDAGTLVRESVAASGATGSIENNLALALAQIGDRRAAKAYARTAVERDPANPVYLDTAGYALQKGGSEADADEAEAAYAAAEQADATSYVSSNNRAVLLAQRGREDDAIDVLRGVVADQPDYAVAWHNLGTLWSGSWSPVAAIRGQGALAEAGDLDAGLRGHEGLLMDDEIYRSGLDVSKFDVGGWQYGTSAASVSQRLTWSVVVLLLLRLLWLLGLDRVAGRISERALQFRGERWSWWRRRPRSSWAVAVTLLVMAGPLAFSVDNALDLWLVAALAGLVAAPLLVRGVLARATTTRVSHEAWMPALAVSGASAVVGLSFAPFPVMEATGRRAGLVRWAAPVAVAAIAAVAMLVVWSTGSPMYRVVAASALALLASVLVPVRPIDGALLGGRRTQAAITGAMAAGTVALAFQWV